jgi:hypothetical protein
MMTIGIIFLGIGLLLSAFKGYLVWELTHTIHHGGAPTLDFPIFCPIPLAAGTSFVLSALGGLPFRGFGFVLYVGLALVFGLVHLLFYRLGEPERQRQLEAIRKRGSLKGEPHA